jgi:hypothetical protein
MFNRELVIGIVIGAVLLYAVWRFFPNLYPGKKAS